MNERWKLSGLEEILQWADEVGLDDFASIRDAFDKDGRLPLEEVLSDQLAEFKERLGESQEVTPIPQQQVEILEESEQRDSLTDEVKSIVTSFINFFRSN